MNYTNSHSRIQTAGASRAAAAGEEMTLSLERDSRGVHLRLRKASTLPRVQASVSRPVRARIAAIAIASGLATFGSAQAAPLLLDFDLPGIDYVTQWTNLANTNSTLAPSLGTGTLAPVSPGYQAGSGFYSFTGHYAFTFSKSDFGLGVDLETVILQIDWAPNTEYDVPFEGGPTLSYNGGTQEVPFDYAAVTGSEYRTTFGGITYHGWAFQWDLSAIGADISSITIHAPVGVHTSVSAVQVNAGENFVQAVPEPGAVLSLIGGVGMLLGVRRRKSCPRI